MGARLLAINQQRLLDMISSFEREGLVDSHFRLANSLKRDNGPLFMSNLITQYCSDARDTLGKIIKTLEETPVNYCKLEELCLKIKGATSCIGAVKVGMACSSFRQAVAEKSKDYCILALNHMKHEFFTLEDKMNVFVQLDRRIARS